MIDDDQNIFAARNLGLTNGFNEAERAAAQRYFEQHIVGPAELFITEGGEKSTSGASRRIGARFLMGSSPGLSVAKRQLEPAPAHQPALQGGDKPGVNQGRFSASGGADDRKKAARAKSAQKFVDLFFAAEKEMIFVGRKWSQPRKGIKQSTGLHQPWRALAWS